MAPHSPEDENAFPAETEALLSELRLAAERRSRLNRWARPLCGICGLYIVLYFPLINLLHVSIPAAYAAPAALFENVSVGVMCFTGVLPEILFGKYIEKSKSRLQKLIQEFQGDPRAIGALAQLCRHTHLFSVSDIALDPLLKLLPTLKAGDARYLSDSNMEALLSLLVVNFTDRLDNRTKNLPLAVLKALELIGDSRAIEPVKRLTTGRSNRLYHQAAQECLAFLEQHAEERDYNRTLLLASSAEVDQKTLLRATLLPAETQPELLLRAANSEERG